MIHSWDLSTASLNEAEPVSKLVRQGLLDGPK